AENFAGDSVAIVSNSGGYKFKLSDSDFNGKTFIGSNGADTITNEGENVTINSGDGNDYIINDGDNVLINGGESSNTIANFIGKNITLNGGAGNDSIANIFGSNVLIDGGEGDDIITSGGLSATINAGAGNDLIQNALEATVTTGEGFDTIQAVSGNQFTVTDFSKDDAIQILGGIDSIIAATSISAIDGGIVISGESDAAITVNGVTESTIGKNWSYNGNNASYRIATLQGAYLDGGVVKFRESVEGATEVELSGINGAPVVNGDFVNLTAENFAGASVAVVSNSGGYQFNLSGNLNGKSFVGTNAIDTITNNGANVAINALGGNDIIMNSGNNVTVTTGEGFDTIQAAKGIQFTVTDFSKDDVIQLVNGSAVAAISTIDGGIVISGESGVAVTVNGVTESTIGKNWSYNGNNASYRIATLQGAYIDGGTVKFRESVEGAAEVELSGINGAPVVNGDVVTLTAENFAGASVAVLSNSGGYQFNLSGNLNGKSFVGTNAIDTITNNGANVAINALGGNDIIMNSGNNVTV
ncbi:MAG: hypothetical protein J5497_01150, partial [Selenomonadaceae bacterium]|nr:hypothetical protein [Selenomonadaceae bacterium]